jgi:hypothetical protein
MTRVLPVFLIAFVGISSCSESKEEEKLSHEEKIEKALLEHVGEVLDGDGYSLDNIKIRNISQKTKLENESEELKRELIELMQDAKQGNTLYNKLQNETPSAETSNQSADGNDEVVRGITQEELKEKMQKLSQELQIKLALSKEKALRAKTADSTTTLYYEVIADVIQKKKVKGILVVKVSPEYKLLSTKNTFVPIEFLESSPSN